MNADVGGRFIGRLELKISRNKLSSHKTIAQIVREELPSSCRTKNVRRTRVQAVAAT